MQCKVHYFVFSSRPSWIRAAWTRPLSCPKSYHRVCFLYRIPYLKSRWKLKPLDSPVERVSYLESMPVFRYQTGEKSRRLELLIVIYQLNPRVLEIHYLKYIFCSSCSKLIRNVPFSLCPLIFSRISLSHSLPTLAQEYL